MGKFLAAAFVGLALLAGSGSPASAAFRWALEPFCDVLVFDVQPTGAAVSLHGYADETSACQNPESVFFPGDGSAAVGPNGLVQLGFVLVFDGFANHIYAIIDLGTLSGQWLDDFGFSGDLVFLGGAGPAGGDAPARAPSGKPSLSSQIRR